MRRPITITHPVVVNDGKPFEAYDASIHYISNEILRKGDWVEAVQFFSITATGLDSYVSCLDDEREALIKWQLAQALNPPIKVTQAVLEAMEKVHEGKYFGISGEGSKIPFSIDKDDRRLGHPCKFVGRFTTMCLIKSEFDYIQADCPMALQVLLPFNTEGELFDA